ncbi:hypothetical protein P8452_11112 [Trifolium repens]|nr:hypothetical protein P8452_11112 [Trifolium repens]
MDKPSSESSSSSSSKLSWLWVIDALASFKEFPLPTLQALIDAAPISCQDFSQNTTEFIALRCLEELSSSSSSTLDSSTVPLDSSLTCLDVLDQILYKVPSSNLNMSICGAEFLKWDLNSFIMHKRGSKVKCHLEKMKESILDGTLQLPDHLKEMSGLFQTNLAHMVCANEGKRDDRSLKGDGNSTYAEGLGAKENPASLLLKDGNESSKKRLLGSKRLCSKRTRVDSAAENSGSCPNEKLVCINECDEFLRSTENTKCNASTYFDSKKEKQVSRLGKEVSENSIEEIQISKNVGRHSEMNNTETICDGSLEDIHIRCTTSHLCQSSGQHKVIHGESEIPFDTTLTPQHTCAHEGKRDDRSVKGDGNSTYAEGMGAKENSASLLLKDGPKSSKKRLPGSKRLCSKRTRVDLADENSGSCLNEKLVCINECDEFLRGTEKIKHNTSTDFDSNKGKQVSQLGKEVSENSIEEIQISKNVGHHSEMNDTETLCDGSLEDIHIRCTTSNLCQSNGQHKVIHGESDVPSNTTLMPQHTCEGETNDTVHVDPMPINDGNTNNNQHMTNQSQPQPQQKKPNVASSNVSQKPVASDKNVIDIVSEVELSSDSDMYHNEKIAVTAKKDEFLRSQQTFGQPQQKKPNVASSNVSLKPVASDKNVVDIVSEAELSTDSDMYHNEKIALTSKKDEFPRSQQTFGQPQQKEPNVASSNVLQKPVASDKAVVDTVREAELSSDSEMYHNEEIALTAKKDEFMRSQHAFRQDLPAMTESTEQNLCIKCNEVGQLLVCKTSTCSLMMHKNCLGDSAQLDANGNFLCPFCEYSHTISEYLEAKKSASLAKKQLAIFRSKGIRN